MTGFAPTVRVSPGRTTQPNRLLERLRKRFEAGETEALLDAVDLCARCALPLPLWAAEEFCACYGLWAQFEVQTLDEAFRVKRPKKMHMSNRALREWLRPRIAQRVLELQKEGVPTDDRLFNRVSDDLGGKFKGPTVKKIYYEQATQQWLKLLPNLKIP